MHPSAPKLFSQLAKINFQEQMLLKWKHCRPPHETLKRLHFIGSYEYILFSRSSPLFTEFDTLAHAIKTLELVTLPKYELSSCDSNSEYSQDKRGT